MNPIIISCIGILVGIILIILMSYYGHPPLMIALIAAVIICICSGTNSQEGLVTLYSTGFGNAMKNMFLMFLGCMTFGYVMDKAGCAHAIAYAISDHIPARFGPSVVLLIAAVLALGGLSAGGYLVVAPIGIIMFSKANYSKDILLGCIMGGMWTFTNMMPLSPSIQNGVIQGLLGTSTSAGLIPGMICGGIIFVCNIVYVTWQARRWRDAGRGFDSWDEVPEDNAEFRNSLPSVWVSILPIIVVLVVYNVFHLVLATSLWVGVITCTLLRWKKFTPKEWIGVWEKGCLNALGPVVNLCTMSGIGAIVSITPFFKALVEWCGNSSINPYLLCFLGANLLAFMCGSASGGLNTLIPAIQPLLDTYVARGFSLDNMARIMVAGCIGLDSMPNNGSLIAACDIIGTTMKKSYKPVFVTCTLIPLVACFIAIPLCSFFYGGQSMFEHIIGASTGWRKIEYNWRDVALYALAVGAEPEESDYYYERNLKTLPSFGSLPYWNAVNNYPQQPLPFPAANLARELMMKELGQTFHQGMHMSHELILHRPIDAIKGSLVFKDTVSNIYDRGEGKGVIVETKVPVYDEAGRLICENISRTHMQTSGGFGGPPAPRARLEYPDRTPDAVVDSAVSPVQNALYRLTGDTNYEHIDMEILSAGGIKDDRFFMQGLASFGFACRMLIGAFIPSQPERVKRLSVQMRSVCYLGIPIQLRAWKIAEGKAIFRLVDLNTEKAILDNCEFEWE